MPSALGQFLGTSWVSYHSVQFWHSLSWASIRSHKWKGRVPTRLPLLYLDTAAGGSPDCPHFFPADYKFRASLNPLWFDNSLECLTELRTVLCLRLHKWIARWSPQGKVWKGPELRSFCSVESGCTRFLPYPCALQPGSCPELRWPECLYGTSFCGHDWVNHRPRDWTHTHPRGFGVGLKVLTL